MADRVALITGGSRGIGAAVALRSARDGTAIAIGYRSCAAQAEAVAATCRAAGHRCGGVPRRPRRTARGGSGCSRTS